MNSFSAAPASETNDFQFLIEELAVGAHYKLPYLHVVVNNSYLGLIRQAQRGFEMDFEVSLAFENINTKADGDAVPGYGVDHVAVAEGLGCKAIRVKTPNESSRRPSPARTSLWRSIRFRWCSNSSWSA